MATGPLIDQAFQRMFGGATPAAEPALPVVSPQAAQTAEEVSDRIYKNQFQRALADAQTAPIIGPTDIAVMLNAIASMQRQAQGGR